jgi:hypothetical protein
MFRRLNLCLTAFAVLVLAPPAVRAAGPAADPTQTASSGVLSAGNTDFFALGAGNETRLDAMSTRDGRLHETRVPGSWGLPVVTQNGDVGGLSPDGKTLVLSSGSGGSPSRFVVVNVRTLQPTRHIVLDGLFAFDALSPDGSRLFLIQHKSLNDGSHYVVRGYDLSTGRLLDGTIADKTQSNWVMQGYPMTRATSAGGRMVYTLYQNPGGYPFIHALDTARGAAHCIGLPWTGDQSALSTIALTLYDGGKTLVVDRQSGRPWLTVNTANWRLTHVRLADRFP